MKNIYLVGMMGTGKTETARVLAERLSRTFVDMDEAIEKKEKMSIPDIFRIKGEPYFRKSEKSLVEDLAQKTGLVVACGGGAFVDPENIRLMKASGTVICLTSSPDVILKRTRAFAHRPLLNVEDPLARIQKLLDKRASSYAQAHKTINCDKLSIQETAGEVIRCLNLT